MVKLFDLSQPLNEEAPFWPFYPPFEVKYIKRKPEHGVNAQYIKTSNHIGTHFDAPRHFKTDGMTIDEVPLDWLYGDGVVVDLTDEMEELEVYTPEMIEEKADIREGDILVLHTGWHKHGQFGEEADEEKYILKHPGAHPDMVDWLKEKNIKVWGVDAVSTDHPMDLPIGRFLGENTFGQCKEVRAQAEEKFGEEKLEELFPEEDYQITHNELFPDDICHMENLGGEISAPEIQNKRITIGCFPWKFKGGEAAFCRVVAFLEE